MLQPITDPNQYQEEWLKILQKGMITLPKKWRDELNIQPGARIKATKLDNAITLQTIKEEEAPYRIYSKTELDQFIKNDKLPKKLAKKAQQLLK